MTSFIDQVTLHVQGGNGGHGCASVHREKFKPLGGPDGGNGGNGGDVVLVVDPSVTTLLDFHRSPHRSAGNGKPGQGDHRNGAYGEHLELSVPEGTVVSLSDGTVLTDMLGIGTRYVIAAGGRGGLGNAALASTKRKAPGFALLGEKGVTRDVILELKTVADVGLVGYPSAGKSSLIAAMSAARPKIADYPFTTLRPNLGIVSYRDFRSFVMADIPGIIEGAHAGKGLGLRFLRHIERNSLLLFMIPADTDNIQNEYNILLNELKQYNPELLHKERLLAITKSDMLDDELKAEISKDLPAIPYLFISSVAQQGLTELKDLIWKHLNHD